jgi:cob(I)alamin adenosyltransferase
VILSAYLAFADMARHLTREHLGVLEAFCDTIEKFTATYVLAGELPDVANAHALRTVMQLLRSQVEPPEIFPGRG